MGFMSKLEYHDTSAKAFDEFAEMEYNRKYPRRISLHAGLMLFFMFITLINSLVLFFILLPQKSSKPEQTSITESTTSSNGDYGTVPFSIIP